MTSKLVKSGAIKLGEVRPSSLSLSTVVLRGLSSVEEVNRDGRLWASQAAACSRRGFLESQRKGLDIVSPASSMYFDMGNLIEEKILSALHKQGALLFSQYRLPDMGLNLGGKIDGIILIGGKVKLIEIKTCGELPNSPKPEHLAQSLIYSAVSGLDPVVFYVSRHVAGYDGQLKIKEFPLEPTPTELQAAMFTTIYARLAINMGVMPDIPMHFTSEKNCGFCNFIPLCWHGEMPEKSYPPVSAKQHGEIVLATNELVAHLMDPEVRMKRTNGILHHISKFGDDNAKEKLSGSWAELLQR